MPSSGTKKHPIRVDDDLWEAYRKVCDADGTNCSEDIREHIRARVREANQDQSGEKVGKRSQTNPDEPQ